MNTNLGIGDGYYVIRKGKSLDTMEVVSEFPNLITDVGLDNVTTRNLIERCFIGTGNTPPVFSDTQLVSTIANTTFASNYGNTYSATPQPNIRAGWRYRFNPGQGTGNISELGVGWLSGGSTGTQVLFSRALVRDTNGDPTTITKLADEYLDVSYYVRLYPNVNDVSSEVVYKEVNRTILSRPANVNLWSAVDFISSVLTGSSNNTSSLFGTTSSLGSITSNPSGTGVACTTESILPKVSGENRRRLTKSWSIDRTPTGSLAAYDLFRAGTTGNTATISFQGSFTPPLEKTSDENFSMTWDISWSRV